MITLTRIFSFGNILSCCLIRGWQLGGTMTVIGGRWRGRRLSILTQNIFIFGILDKKKSQCHDYLLSYDIGLYHRKIENLIKHSEKNFIFSEIIPITKNSWGKNLVNLEIKCNFKHFTKISIFKSTIFFSAPNSKISCNSTTISSF